MKGPSLDAIRKFKEQQERKKLEDEERRQREKISTLEHRANQGDRKAKQLLQKLDKSKTEAKHDVTQSHKNTKPGTSKANQSKEAPPRSSQKSKPVDMFDFDELMRLAKTNKNEIRKEDRSPAISTKSQKPARVCDPPRTHVPTQPSTRAPESLEARIPGPGLARVSSHPPSQAPNSQHKQSIYSTRREISPDPRRRDPRPFIQHRARNYYDEDDSADDDYEEDDFVVADGNDDVQDELQKTLKSVFRYDKRRCDMREDELDRQYRAIGKVSNFEDLEREERRAARMAAAEDARAQREEEERKRLKKIRMSEQRRRENG